MRRECRERFPRHGFQRKPLVKDPGTHHGTCVTHVPWCMSGSEIRGVGENVPGIPGACVTRNFTYLARGPLLATSHTPLIDGSTATRLGLRSCLCVCRPCDIVIIWPLEMEWYDATPRCCSRNKRPSQQWWRHQMETFSALLAISAGNSPVPGEFPAQRPVTQSCHVFLDLRPNKRVNNGEAGDWRRHRSHYDVIVMTMKEHILYDHMIILCQVLHIFVVTIAFNVF